MIRLIPAILLSFASVCLLPERINAQDEVVGKVLDFMLEMQDSTEEGGKSVSANKTILGNLSDELFAEEAEKLGVEVAAIKAVALIEAGSQMKGFWAPGVPIVNFDKVMYNKLHNKVDSQKGAKDEMVPEGLSGFPLKRWTRLVEARRINYQGANIATFWGMFQIGGFNYKRCGCETLDEFVELMSRSEADQLDLFVSFIKNCGMAEDLKKKNWAAFARKYNGASYAKRGYHTKMEAAYKKFKAEESK